MISKLADEAGKLGICLAMESLRPQESQLVVTLKDAKRMYDEVNSPNLKILIDTTAMSVQGETIDDWFDVFGDEVIHTHFIDSNPYGHLAWGFGNRSLQEYLEALNRHNYQGCLGQELTEFDYYEKNKDRIQVVEGDIVKENLAINSKDYEMLKNNITTVINAGALVKHFGISKLFNDINVKGTENVVEFCKKENKRLIHISTISVSGNGEKEETVEETKENINSKKIFKESDLYIGQNISGIYTITKFEAEKIVLKAIKSGLDAQILRMGNITNRYSDGVFQQNVEENAFAKRLKSFIELGMFPKYLLDHAIELGPVDLCAEAVIKILEYDSNCNVLHIYNSKLLPIKLLVNTMKELGINIEAVDDETMSRKLKEILNDNFKKEILSGIIHDIDSKKRLIYTSNIRVSYDFSEKYLEKIGFSWKNIDREYILKYMNYFKGIGFIEY